MDELHSELKKLREEFEENATDTNGWLEEIHKKVDRLQGLTLYGGLIAIFMIFAGMTYKISCLEDKIDTLEKKQIVNGANPVDTLRRNIQPK